MEKKPEITGALAHPEPVAPGAAKFVSVEHEAEYRAHSSAADVRRGRLILLILVPPMLLFAMSDYQLFGQSPTFYGLIAARTAYITYSLAVVASIRESSSATRRDLAYTLWLFATIALAVVVNLSRPAAYTGHVVIDVLLLLLVCLATPVPFSMIVLGASLFTIAEFGVLFFARVAPHHVAPALWLGALLHANIIGLWGANRINRTSRQRFDAWFQERKVRRRLTQAREELTLLEGIIPICWECGLVRDSDKNWVPLPEYIETGADKRFIEGACLSCARNHEEG